MRTAHDMAGGLRNSPCQNTEPHGSVSVWSLSPSGIQGRVGGGKKIEPGISL